MAQDQLIPVHTVYIKGSAKKPYEVKIYEPGHGAYCTCPNWKNGFPGVPAELRICKHVRQAIREIKDGTATYAPEDTTPTGTKTADDFLKGL